MMNKEIFARSAQRLALLCLLLAIASCGIFGGKDKAADGERAKTNALTETQLYGRVQELLNDKSYELAVRNLQLLESRFPFGSYAEQAQLEIIYAYHQSGDDDAAVAAAERFLRLHADHPDADYAWYMKGLANYTLKPGLLARFYKTDYSARDVVPARQSFREFQQFLLRFPGSPYAADARARMIHIKHVLARHELTIANYYVKRHAYLGAINRAKTVLEQYPGAEANGDALALLGYAYSRVGLNDLADKNIALLKHNFPQHADFDAQGNYRYGSDYDPARRSLINRLSLGLFDPPRAPLFDSRES